MGAGKRDLEKQEYMHELALQIAVDSGVIKECEQHLGIYLKGSMCLDDAYKLANSRITQGIIVGVDRRGLTDEIKSAVESDVSGSCYYCDKRDDD